MGGSRRDGHRRERRTRRSWFSRRGRSGRRSRDSRYYSRKDDHHRRGGRYSSYPDEEDYRRHSRRRDHGRRRRSTYDRDHGDYSDRYYDRRRPGGEGRRHHKLEKSHYFRTDFSADSERGSKGGEQMGFTSTGIRHAFIRKVYGIVLLQLLLTFGIVAVVSFVPQLRAIAVKYWFVGLISWCLSFVVLMVLGCGPQSVRRKFPMNVGLLVCFTVFLSIAVAFTVARVGTTHSPWTLALAFGITIAIVLLFTAFAFQTKWDITKMRGIFMILFGSFYIIAIVWAIVASFVAMDKMTYNIVELVIATVGVCVYIGLLVYDTQLILGGKHRYSISPEDYVMGAVAIYIDIVYIFLYVLRIILAAKGIASANE